MIDNYKSQICTDINQSEHFLALGLKQETADCCYYYYDGEYLIGFAEDAEYPSDIPAWSLHRLLSMLPDDAPKIFWILDGASISIEFEYGDSDFFPHKGDIYEGVVNCIEWLIKEGYFNKEYLEE